MTSPLPRYAGVWLPLVTPFKDGDLDETSLRRLVRSFAPRVDGLVLCATTGEAPALSAEETQRVVETARDELAAVGAASRILVGLAGASTAGVVRALKAAERWGGDGFLATCPYYVRPAQEGLRLHFEAIAETSPADILIYNIPYRTGVNLANDTLLRIAERTNVVGLKDCCADREQSRDIIRRKPAGFAVLMGDDAGFAAALEDGADGGVTASAHIDPEGFRAVHAHARAGRTGEAAAAWAAIAAIPDLLFAEPSPAALKHCLWRTGLIDSPELRLPMTPVSESLAARLDAAIARGWTPT
ncbi:4-hydroxy-tetrahydrodipicolinate synthase [Phenylobacterium soli]|uniref:4-hydroxy-tetrahydrodipicolinate synthase n=1 Tax=Phenylobacterium soli TaxID=2170551 RepID=A0A328AJA1_9CAUL|nr:4-hydroxy-tetrahydrodipicolinate synthase [Phenylobacterium soli]RAK54689.1 4-hydroxy-tetrahydrodipicolinate synthase [Phenylobacterium soli]